MITLVRSRTIGVGRSRAMAFVMALPLVFEFLTTCYVLALKKMGTDDPLEAWIRMAAGKTRSNILRSNTRSCDGSSDGSCSVSARRIKNIRNVLFGTLGASKMTPSDMQAAHKRSEIELVDALNRAYDALQFSNVLDVGHRIREAVHDMYLLTQSLL